MTNFALVKWAAENGQTLNATDGRNGFTLRPLYPGELAFDVRKNGVAWNVLRFKTSGNRTEQELQRAGVATDLDFLNTLTIEA